MVMERALLCHSDPNPTEVSCILSTSTLASLPSFAVRQLLHLQWQREGQGSSGGEGSIRLLFPFLSIPLGSHSTASFLPKTQKREFGMFISPLTTRVRKVMRPLAGCDHCFACERFGTAFTFQAALFVL